MLNHRVIGRPEKIDIVPPKYSVVSLFCGAGGLDLGFDRQGFKTIWANDFNEDAVKTMRHWLKHGRVVHGDIRKISDIVIPKANVMLGGFPCFAEGTLVNTGRGMIPIEKVEVGDYVLTLENRYRKVLTTMYDIKQGIHKISIAGVHELMCTDNHPFLVRQFNEIPMCSLDGGCIVQVNGTEPKKTHAKDIKEGDFVGVPINKVSLNLMNLTFTDCWLLGRYIAEGTIEKCKGIDVGVTLTLDANLFYAMKKGKEDYSLATYKRLSENSWLCTIRDAVLVTLCKYCGVGEDKRIHQFILDLPKEHLEFFLKGYLFEMSNKKDIQKVVAKSKELIYQLAQVVMKIYKVGYDLKYVTEKFPEFINKATISKKGVWELKYCAEPKEHSDWYYDNDLLWFKVKENKFIKDYDKPTYNIEVEEDHTYTVWNIGTYNCQGFSSMGNRVIDDPRNFLYKEYVRILKHVQPYAFIGENVQGLLTMANGEVIDQIIRDFSDVGYNVSYQLVNAADYGVPQDRLRIIITGFRKDLVDAKFPVPPQQARVTMRDALWGLPMPDKDDIHRGSFSPRFMSVNRRRGWDDVSYTILAGGRGCPLHPSSPEEIFLGGEGKGVWQFGDHGKGLKYGDEGFTRRFAWWEAALIQTFPVDMYFYGSLESKYKQVGNAVPVKLGEAFAKEIYKELVRLGLHGEFD